MAGGAMQRYQEAQTLLEKAIAAGEVKRKALINAQDALTSLGRRGLGNGRSAAPSASQVQAAAKKVEDAASAVRQAATEEQKLEGQVRAAKVKAAEESPEHFMPKKVEVPTAPVVPTEVAPMPAPEPSGPPPTTIALVFPGQGSQYVNMLGTVKDNPEVQQMVAAAEAVLGWNPLDVCLSGPEDKLEETSICQPCMFLGGMAGLVKLRESRPEAVERPGSVAGLSLGEYTALCAAGVFTFEEGMKLVKVRGQAMAEAAKTRPQSMLSVFGVDQETLEKLCKEQAADGEICQIANHLFPRGFSCAGTTSAITKLKEEVEKAGAMQAKLLKTSGGFHTDLMRPAQEKLSAALEELMPKMKPPRCDVYMNVTGKKIKAGTPPADFVPMLAKQLCSAVLWEASVRLMIEDGMTEFFEVGPMRQLKAMMKRIDMNMWSNMTNVEI